MSATVAVQRAGQVRESLLDHGLDHAPFQGVSIDLLPGRPGTPNGGWYDTRFEAVLSHHIVSLRSQGLNPGYALVRGGRPDLPGPLANGYGGFDLRYRIICMGWANHPGEGGPWDVGPVVIPRDTGRPYIWGTEYEGGVREADWTDDFREFMARSNAALIDVPWISAGQVDRHGEHKTWAPGRKPDRLNYSTSDGRDELRPFLAANATPEPGPAPTIPPPLEEEDDMKPYIVVYQSGQWVVAPDLSSRTGISSGTDLAKLAATGQYIHGFPLSASQMARIPVAGAVQQVDLVDDEELARAPALDGE